MYNRYRRCCCQNNYNPKVIETICDNVGTTAQYANASNNCMNNDDCDCGFDEEPSVFPSNPMLAQSYVPIQTMDKTFTPCCGLKMGTIFPELVSPYAPCQSIEEINYLKRANEIGEGCNS
jgi:hypothetical protein